MLLGEIDFDPQGSQYLRLHREHLPALGVYGVLIAEEVENPVNCQQLKLGYHVVTKIPGLGSGAGIGDHNVSKIGRLSGRVNEPPARRARESQNIRRRIYAEVPMVQLLQHLVISHDDREST